MDDLSQLDDEEYEEQIEQMILENGMLVHALINVLIRKGLVAQEEIDAEMDKLYNEMESFGEERKE